MTPPAQPRRIALIGNYLPRRCGIATFTYDIWQALDARYPEVECKVWAMDDGGEPHAYPDEVAGSIAQDNPDAYQTAAQDIAAFKPDIVWLQHEFGIFGGPAGMMLLPLLDRLSAPLVVTLHTVLSHPDPAQRRVMDYLVERADTLIVMADAGRRILIECYAADPSRIAVIPHGIPDRPLVDTAVAKRRHGLGERPVGLTFGLLSPGKGIETMIAALPEIIARIPDFLYVVIGETHPHIRAQAGESYRDGLMAQARGLGVADNILWISRFFDTDELLDYLEAADVYVTPYLNPAQITSGTLAYAVGLGKAVVSTPYVHAQELLADGIGRLVPFGDSQRMADEIVDLLSDRAALDRLRHRTYDLGRSMIWPRLAEAAFDRFGEALVRARPTATPRLPAVPTRLGEAALARLTDGTGILQHSRFSVPDRAHGYCTDDNARGLILACRAGWLTPEQRRHYGAIYAAFLNHAWNAQTGAFRNFMSFERRWLEETGSQDSSGRALWALAHAAAAGHDDQLRDWAGTLFDEALPSIAGFASMRTRAFTALACVEAWVQHGPQPRLRQVLSDAVDALLREYRASSSDDWQWFEPVLAYDNARLPEALLRAGTLLGRDDAIATGLAALTWLAARQTAPDGHFRPVGSDSFGRQHAEPLPFDQQPLEAQAMIAASQAALVASGNARWRATGLAAYRWFLGANDLQLALAQPQSGECFDGLTPRGVNRNQGAESVLAFQLATYIMNNLMNMRDARLGAVMSIGHGPGDAAASPVAA